MHIAIVVVVIVLSAAILFTLGHLHGKVGAPTAATELRTIETDAKQDAAVIETDAEKVIGEVKAKL